MKSALEGLKSNEKITDRQTAKPWKRSEPSVARELPDKRAKEISREIEKERRREEDFSANRVL